MPEPVLVVGSLVCVTSYGPLRGLRGTVRCVLPVTAEAEEPRSFYLVQLEGTDWDESIWLEHHEVERLAPLSVS